MQTERLLGHLLPEVDLEFEDLVDFGGDVLALLVVLQPVDVLLLEGVEAVLLLQEVDYDGFAFEFTDHGEVGAGSPLKQVVVRDEGLLLFDVEADVVFPEVLVSQTAHLVHEILEHLPEVELAVAVELVGLAVAGDQLALPGVQVQLGAHQGLHLEILQHEVDVACHYYGVADAFQLQRLDLFQPAF